MAGFIIYSKLKHAEADELWEKSRAFFSSHPRRKVAHVDLGGVLVDLHRKTLRQDIAQRTLESWEPKN